MTNECAFKHASGAKGQVSNELLFLRFFENIFYRGLCSHNGFARSRYERCHILCFFLIKEPRSVDLSLQ
jgi:hypothetical protein